MRETVSTRSRILDQAEAQYAIAGLAGFSLREITSGAGVNLAAVSYHFQSRKSLIKEMLLRVLEPAAEERSALLRKMRSLHPDSLQPTHVIMCLVLPLMRDLVSDNADHRSAFVLRVASDTDAWVRHVMAESFCTVGVEYERAFAASAPGLGKVESAWRTALFCNVIPGNLANHSLIVMCQRLLGDPGNSLQMVLRAVASLAEVVLTGKADALEVESAVAETLIDLGRASAVLALRDKMLIRAENSDISGACVHSSVR